MIKKIANSIITRTVLICLILFSAVPCYAFGASAGQISGYINSTVSAKASSLGVSGKQGIIDYYADNSMTLGGEWYVLSFIQNGDKLDFSRYEKNLTEYLKSSTVSSEVSREKFALTLIALGSDDTFAKKYIQQVCDESIGKSGIMSYVFGLHLLNNGCISKSYSKTELIDTIFSLQKNDGGWTISGEKSDVDVTAMTLQSLAPYYSSYSTKIDKAVSLLSKRQSENGDFQSYGVYNAESTAQVIIALSALGFNADTDSRFIKDGYSCIDALLKYKTDGGFSHTEGGSVNNSASFQALEALVAFSRFLRSGGSFYKFSNTFDSSATKEVITSDVTVTAASKETTSSGKYDSENITTNQSTTVFTENNESSTERITENQTDESNPDLTETSEELTTFQSENESVTNTENNENKSSKTSRAVPKYKIIACAVILFIAGIVSLVFVILRRRNYKNFIVIFAVALILIAIVVFTDIVPAGAYYNGKINKVDNPVGTVTFTVRCDTVAGKENAPENPVIIESCEFEIEQGETVYSVLSRASRQTKIPFEHNSNCYVIGIDNLYEFQFGSLSGWMYKVNGELPGVGCNEYVLSDGDTIEWLYSCDIGNDLVD